MNPESVLQVTQRSSGKPSSAKAMDQQLVSRAWTCPVMQRTPEKLPSLCQHPRHHCNCSLLAFAPPGSPVDQYTLLISTAEWEEQKLLVI